MPPHHPARAQSTSRTPPTHTPPASATPSSGPPVGLGQPMPSSIEGVQPSPQNRFLEGHTSAREMPPPPVPMRASPSLPSPMGSVGTSASSTASGASTQALHPPPPSHVHRIAFLRRLRATTQPEEPAQTPNVAAVPTELQGTTDSVMASISDKQQVPEAAPIRTLAEVVPDKLQDATVTPLSHIIAERQASAAPEPSHILSASQEAPKPSHILSASREAVASESAHIPDVSLEAAGPEPFHVPEASRDTVAPEPSHLLSASWDAVAPGSSHIPDTSWEAAVPKPFHVPDASQDTVAPEPSHILSASRDAVAPGSSHVPRSSHIPDTSREAAVPEPFYVPDASRDAVAPELSQVRNASGEAAAPKPFHDPSVSRESTAPEPRTADSSDSENKMDTESIPQDDDVPSDALERDTFPLIHQRQNDDTNAPHQAPRAPYPEVHLAHHFTATYWGLLTLDPSNHMGDLIE
ncbi:hypothetical protein EDB83DRAFT_2322232 [Lactarius deliciosus]|nr:hypothetical protein EDB83DRAFT_2322232 [Lactarius deliciosus]